jgi:hypothetical protein
MLEVKPAAGIRPIPPGPRRAGSLRGRQDNEDGGSCVNREQDPQLRDLRVIVTVPACLPGSVTVLRPVERHFARDEAPVGEDGSRLVGMYGRDDEDWDQLADAGLAFLIERARLEKLTSYTELNATLQRRTGLAGFDFGRADERAAMGHLLYLIVERNRPTTNTMISALVTYLDANDAGTGFYAFAQELGELPRNASAQAKLDFWVGQVQKLYQYYS